MRRKLTLIEIAIAVLVLVAISTVLLALRSKEIERGRRLNCLSMLRYMGISFVTYVDNYGDGRYYPFHPGGGVATLSLLYNPCKFGPPEAYHCPSTTDPLTTAASLSSATCSYIGRDPALGPLIEGDPPHSRIAADDSMDHHGGEANILFLDGRAEFITASGNPTGPPLSATED